MGSPTRRVEVIHIKTTVIESRKWDPGEWVISKRDEKGKKEDDCRRKPPENV